LQLYVQPLLMPADACCLPPSYHHHLQEVNHFLNTTEKLLANIQQSAGPFTVSSCAY
jgi:hypothetical protein